jgi:hypothetical protein
MNLHRALSGLFGGPYNWFTRSVRSRFLVSFSSMLGSRIAQSSKGR